MSIYFSELDDKYWINDGDDILWFESSLDAKQALREIELREAVDDEVLRIASWFRKNGLTQIAASIEAKEYKRAS